MMKIFHFLLFYGIAILWPNYFANATPYKEARIIITDKDESTTVHLKQSKSFLANENLPIWMLQNGKLLEIDFENVVGELGPFTTYQDPDSSSAAVYFHKRREFDGTIDARYVIEGLVPDNDNNNDISKNQITDGIKINYPIFERNEWGHTDKTGVTGKKKVAPTYVTEWIGGELPIEEELSAALPGRCSRMFFIETLIVINHKLADELLQHYFDGVPSVVSYVLTLFNTVDMLFTKLNPQNIRINIAGIIIENERDSVPNMASCYKQIEKFRKIVEGIDAICADENLRSYLSDQKHTVLLDSYDVIVYLASYPLYEYIYSQKSRKKEVSHLAGFTSFPSTGIYEYRRNDGKFKPGVSIADFGSFGSFAIIAHEMIHALGIRYHDKQIGMKDGLCCEKLMKARNGHCPQCLDWSNPTKEQVNAIINSPDGCTYVNEPRSLYAPGPRRMLTANEQCQCYGYASAQNILKAQKQQMGFCWNMISTHLFGYCNTHLQCVGNDNKIYSAPVPMDGTPCEEHKFSNKVCWNRVCVEIESRK